VGLTTLTCKKKIVEKPPRNSAGFCGGGRGLSWAVEPRKEEEPQRISPLSCMKIYENFARPPYCFYILKNQLKMVTYFPKIYFGTLL
jgi:hypothetical protein